MASLPTILLILAALSAGATAIATIIAIRSQREASSAIFPIVREEERSRAQRARISIFVWIAITALFVGGWLATLRLATPADTPAPPVAATEAAVLEAVPPTDTPALPTEPPPTHTPVPVQNIESAPAGPTNTPPPAATATPAPSATATSTPSPQPSATPTATATHTPSPQPTATPTNTASPQPSATPTPTYTPTTIAAPSDRTPAPPGVRVGPIQFATELDDNANPIDPTDTFTDGIPAIYAVFSYRGMSPGLNFKAIWYKNGAEAAREEGLWEWGRIGKSFAFLVPKGPGLYKLDLWINDSVVATKLFEIEPRPK